MGERRIFTIISFGLVGLLILGLLGVGGLIFFTRLRAPTPTPVATPYPTPSPVPTVASIDLAIAMIGDLARKTEQTRQEVEQSYQQIHDLLQDASEERDEFKRKWEAAEAEKSDLSRRLQIEAWVRSILFFALGIIVPYFMTRIRTGLAGRFRKPTPAPRRLLLSIDLSREEASQIVERANQEGISLPDAAKSLLVSWASQDLQADSRQDTGSHRQRHP